MSAAGHEWLNGWLRGGEAADDSAAPSTRPSLDEREAAARREREERVREQRRVAEGWGASDAGRREAVPVETPADVLSAWIAGGRGERRPIAVWPDARGVDLRPRSPSDEG